MEVRVLATMVSNGMYILYYASTHGWLEFAGQKYGYILITESVDSGHAICTCSNTMEKPYNETPPIHICRIIKNGVRMLSQRWAYSEHSNMQRV